MKFLNGVLTLGAMFALVLLYYYVKELVLYLYTRFYLKESNKLNFADPLTIMNRNTSDGNIDKKLGVIMISVALVSASIAIIQLTPFGIERIGHIIEKNDFVAYYHGNISTSGNNEVEVIAKLKVIDKDVIPVEIHIVNSYTFKVTKGGYWGYHYDGFNVVFEEIEVIDESGNRYWLQLYDEPVENYN